MREVKLLTAKDKTIEKLMEKVGVELHDRLPAVRKEFERVYNELVKGITTEDQ